MAQRDLQWKILSGKAKKTLLVFICSLSFDHSHPHFFAMTSTIDTAITEEETNAVHKRQAEVDVACTDEVVSKKSKVENEELLLVVTLDNIPPHPRQEENADITSKELSNHIAVTVASTTQVVQETPSSEEQGRTVMDVSGTLFVTQRSP